MPDNIYYRTNPQGLLEAVDVLTGKVVAIQHAHSEFDPNDPEQYSRVVTPTGETVYISKELTLTGRAPDFYNRAYSKLHADLLVQKIVEGYTLTKACNELQLQYSVVNRWKNESMEFRKRLEDAFRDRAEKHADEIMEIAEESRDAKARIEARKWSAEKYNPERFGQKTKISGDKNAPLQFVIQTGVPERGGDGDEIRDVTPQAEESGHLPAPDEKLSQEEVTEGVLSEA